MRVYKRGSESYEVELAEATIKTRRVIGGAVVEDSSRACSSIAKAKWDVDRWCRDRVAEGFERADGSDDITAPSQDELVAAIRADPDDLDNYVVYADWLSDRGDPWGQVILVQHALATLPRFGQQARRDELERAEIQLMFRHSARLWGRLGEIIVDDATQKYACDLIRAGWRCGFLDTATITDWVPGMVETLLDGLATLDIARVLRVIALHCASWPAGSLEALARQRWPCLEDLLIYRGARHDDIDARRLVPLLGGSAAPRLARLELHGSTATDAICSALAASPIAAQLTQLQLTDGMFSDAGIAALARTGFASLRELKLTGGGMPSTARDRLAHLAPKVYVMHDAVEDDDD